MAYQKHPEGTVDLKNHLTETNKMANPKPFI